VRLALVVAALLLTVTGCSDDGGDGRAAATPPPPERVRATLDGVPLTLEVADDPDERAYGLMNRTSVPPGSGMVFRFDGLVDSPFYMFSVPVPLRAVFVREGRVVSTLVMPPCPLADPDACPTYGPEGLYDTVIETAPETLPDVVPGDAYVEQQAP
jgi:uncharacterized membrane protein (UPF0127 family)